MTTQLKQLTIKMALMVLVLFAVYGNTLNHGFVWDDIDVIVDNPQLESLSNIPSLFFSEDRIEGSTGYYRPLTYVSFALDRAVWGLNPLGFNITNLLLHMLAALLFYQVIVTFFHNEKLALAAAMIFSLHPLAGETVNFHSGGRNTLLCACFVLLSLYFYAKEKRAVAVIFFTGAIFSKEFGLLLPALLYLYDRFVRKERPRTLHYLPFLIPLILYFSLRSVAIENANILTSLNLNGGLWYAPYLVINYLIRMANPFSLSVLYDIDTTMVYASLSLVAVIILATSAYYFRKHGEIIFSIGCFLLFLLPVINIIRIDAASLMADRYAYFSLMGFALALAFIIGKIRKEVSVAILLILCVTYAAIDISRNKYWKDDYSFYSQMIKDSPDMALGYNDLGIHYFKNGDMTNAEKYLTIASTKKDITSRLLGANAAVFWQADKFDTAEKLLLRQLQLEPSNPQPYVMLKMIYGRQGKKELARLYGDKATALFPGIEQMMQQRVIEVCRQAENFIAMRSYERAEMLLREAVIINPDFVPALIDMGGINAERGDFIKAEKYLSRAISLEPSNPAAHYNLAQAYLMQGKINAGEEAMKKFREAETLSRQKKGAPSK